MTVVIGKLKFLPFSLILLEMSFGQLNDTPYIKGILFQGINRAVQAKEGIKHLTNVNRFAKCSILLGINCTHL